MGCWPPKFVYYVAMWYTSSVGLSLYNKFLIGSKHGGFPAPLMMTTTHFVMQCVIANIILRIRPSLAAVNLSWSEYGTKVVPPAVCTALDIGLSNVSLAYITLTFYTMCKSSAPVFLLIFAFHFGVETFSVRLAGVIFTICVGLALSVSGKTETEWFGFSLVICASVMSGARWVLIEMILKKPQKERSGHLNPIAILAYLTPVMSVVMGILSLAFEPWMSLSSSPYFNSADNILKSSGIMGVGGCIAFLMILSEFLLISETGALTFAVIGTMKEALTIFVSQVIFQDSFSPLNVAGLIIILIGIALYNFHKGMSRSTADAEREATDAENTNADVESGELQLLVGKEIQLSDAMERRTDSPRLCGGTKASDLAVVVVEPPPGGGTIAEGAIVGGSRQGSPYRTSNGVGSPGASGMHERGKLDDRGVMRVQSC